MSYSGPDDQSEDGELKRSPTVISRKHEDLDFSLSDEDGDTADSLDIKPPQAKLTSRSNTRSSGHGKRSNKARDNHGHHSRTDRYREGERTHTHRELENKHRNERHESSSRGQREFRDREYREREIYRDLSKEHYPRETRDVRYSDLNKYDSHGRGSSRDHREDNRHAVDVREREVRYGESRSVYSDDKHRGRDYTDRELKYLEQEVIESRKEKKYHDGSIEIHHSESKRERKEIKYEEYDDKTGDRMLEDLRERLLDKRRNKENEEHSKESRRHRSRKEHSESGEILEDKTHVKDVNLTNTNELVKEKKDRHHRKVEKFHEENEMTAKEKEERELRREKLLEAEREMARQKEKYKQELEARRERRERKRLSEEKNGETKRRKLEENNEAKHQKASALSNELTGIVTVSDNSEESETEVEIIPEPYSDHDDDKSDETDVNEDSSSHGNSDRYSFKTDHREQSPLSIGGLAKSDRSYSRSRSCSKSRSRSQSRSRSHSRSKSRSRSRTLSRTPSCSRSRSSSIEKNIVEEKPNQNGDIETPKSPKPPSDNLPPYLPGIQGCRSVEEFQCLNRIEEGTYGVVYRARDKRTDEIVALKRLKMEKEKEGFPITSLREINTLLKGQHPNIVTVREIVVGSNMDKIFIVMDYVEHDLKSLMETMRHKKQVFVPGEVKCLLKQLLMAVAHLHDNWILHRDLKTSNLLLSHKGILKVGDFGLAREYGSPLKAYTPIVVTLWYRAPELLLCTKEYSTPIDMWSVGCIFAELLLMNALFPGKSEVDQLNRIFKDLGTPNEKIWPGYNKLPAVQKMTFTEYPVSQLRNRFNMLTETGLNLLNKFLTYNPAQRTTAEDALVHPYFAEAPLPIDPAMFPTWPAKSELGHRKALAASPKPPSGGGQYKKLGEADEESALRFHMGITASTSAENRRLAAMGGGFSLKF